MAGLQDDIARTWAWFRIQPKPARLALAGAGAGALALIYAYDAWAVLLVVVVGLILSRNGKRQDLPTHKRARHHAVRAAQRKALPDPTVASVAKRSDEPTAAEIQRAVADAGRAAMRAVDARREHRGPSQGAASPVPDRDQHARPPAVHHAKPIVEDGRSLWRRRKSFSRGSIVE